MPTISVNHLTKTYQVHEKDPGISGSIKSLFHRKYKEVEAVNDISFAIEQGELVGFIGPNGAGKTTTLKCLSGLLYPTSGDVSVLGFQPWQRQPEYQKQFALVMGQKNQLWWDLPAQETFLLNKAIYEIPEDQYKKTLKKLIDLLDIGKVLKVQVRKLSLGERMKCELVAALLHNPKVLFLDEPTIGLDVVMQKVMRDFIKAYNQEFHATIILTSHYMDDVKELCRRIIIIDQGKIYYDGTLAQVIDKYAQNKILTITLGDQVTKNQLAAYGQVKEFHFPQAKLVVPRKKAAHTASELFNHFQIEDITIEEPSIEAIIRQVFNNQTPRT